MLSENILATLLGAAIGIVPSVVIVVVEVINQRRRERHELNIKRLEMAEEPRLEALREFSEQFGALISGVNKPDFSRAQFTASFVKCATLVSSDTLDAMLEAYPTIISGWKAGTANISPSDKLGDKSVQRLICCLRAEFESSPAQLDKKRKSPRNKSSA